MEVQQRNSTRIYALSNGPNLPEWIGERARRNLSKRDSTIRRRIELLQDFAMPSSSSKIVQSKDGRYIIAAGTYAPRIRCFELDQMGMKFERYSEAEVADIQLLSEDFGKLVILQNDRNIVFHAPYGQHTSLRIPTFGRMMAYERTTCELMVACSGKAGRNSLCRTLGGGEVYRINLEEGRFSAPLNYSPASEGSSSKRSSAPIVGGNCICISPTHALTALGGDDGIVRFWDNRIPQGGAKDDMDLNPFCTLDIKSATSGYGFYDDSSSLYGNPHEVTSLSFDFSGMHIAAGTKGGNVALFDIRSSKPLYVKEHQYGMPIHTLRFHSSSGTLLSGDPKLIKIWRTKPNSAASLGFDTNSDFEKFENSRDEKTGMGSIVANIEGTANFSNFIVAGDEKDSSGNQSGLVLCAGEQEKMQAFYCPALGSAPKWCAFLESITEELEEKDRSGEAQEGGILGQAGGSIYEDYKFLTRNEIESLGIQSLVGTPLLRGYMHGFFIDIGLYNRVRSAANPFEYEEYRKKKIREKMEERQASRIAPKKATKKVNAELADRLESKAGNKTKSNKAAKNLLSDERFGSLFKNPDFQIDEDDINFKLRNPSGVQISTKKRYDDMDSDGVTSGSDYDEPAIEGFNKVSGEGKWNDDINNESDDDYDSDSDEDGFRGGKVRGELYEENKANSKTMRRQRVVKKQKSRKPMGGGQKNIMYEADDYFDSTSGNGVKIGLGEVAKKSSLEKERIKLVDISLGERLEREEEHSKYVPETRKSYVRGEGETREVNYIPKDVQRKIEKERREDQSAISDNIDKKRKRRGVKELKLKNKFRQRGHH